MSVIDPRNLASALESEASGNEIRCPGPGHSAEDRSLCVKVDPGAPDGFVVCTHAPHDDWRECVSHVSSAGPLAPYAVTTPRLCSLSARLIPKQTLHTSTFKGVAQPPARRFPPPWSAEEQSACFIVRDHNGQALALLTARGHTRNINIRSPCWITNPTPGVSRGRGQSRVAWRTA